MSYDLYTVAGIQARITIYKLVNTALPGSLKDN